MRELVLKDDYGVVTGYVYFTESEWRGLLDRFDVRRIQKYKGGYEIQVPCVLCKKYERCEKCPISIVGGRCLWEIQKASEGLISTKTVIILASSLSWRDSVDYNVKEGLKKVSRFLQALPCVRVRKTVEAIR